MKSLVLSIFVLSAASAAFAQQWEFGAIGGVSLPINVSANGTPGNATAGFSAGPTFGVFFGQNRYRNFSGEIRYEFMKSDLHLSGNGQSASFDGVAHAVHYDLVFHTNRKESRTQYFGTVGGGIKLYRGTGAEQAFQPLSQFGYFTKTQSVQPLFTAGAGLNYRLSPKVFLRAEVRDFITPFPTKVLTPAPGVKFGSVLNDIMPMVGISYLF